MNERIRKLRQQFIGSERKVNIDRALIITEVYRENESKPQIIKRALALEAILSRMNIDLRDDELIVGNQTKDPRGVPLFPEYGVQWILKQMDDFPRRKGDRFQITEEEKRALREVLPYWEGKCLQDKLMASLPPFLRTIVDHAVFTNQNFPVSGPGHIIPDYEAVLQRGLKSISEECDKRIAGLDPKDVTYMDKFNLYQACSIVCNALIKFAQRYYEEASRLAMQVTDEKRLGELRRISENCRRVPGEPARDLWEALQSIYFLQVAIQIEANGLSIALGRLDQILYPYYRQGVAKGTLTREMTLELIECFYLKISEIDKIYSNEASRFLQGPAHGQVITLSGVDKGGRDATNELSHLFVEADLDIRLVQPDLAIRFRHCIPQDFLSKVCINIQENLTKPKLFNDEVIIQTLMSLGICLEDARDWGSLGCSEPIPAGKTNSWGDAGHLNLAKCLELALNDGKCMLTQKQMGPHTGDAGEFKTFDNVLGAFKAQVDYFIKYMVLYDNIIDQFHAQIAPLPLYSLVTKECLEKGIEFNKGGARYNYTAPLGIGPITTGDSLTAIRTLVFERQLLSMRELLEALEENFEGREDVRLMLINRSPKFGNDDDIADDMCNEVLKIFCDEVRNYRNPRDGLFIGSLYHLTGNIPFGQRTAATADGRRSGEPLNDGGISPVHGRDKKGITAVAKSVGKLDIERVPHGSILNQRIHPSILQGDDKRKVFMQYLHSFMDLGGWEAQFNVVTSEMLQKAQKKPEEYSDLVIRVAGYSAYFTQLEVELQNDIIERTEHKAY